MTYDSVANGVGNFYSIVDIRLRGAGAGDAVEGVLDEIGVFAEACIVGLRATAG